MPLIQQNLIPSPPSPSVYRNDYRFQNTTESILRFPFAFDTDKYLTTVNVEPHDRTGATAAFHSLLDVDEHYHAELAERDYVLSKDPSRFHSMAHMETGGWEVLDFVMSNLAQDFPQHFSLTKDGDRYTWHNRLLGLRDSFTFGKAGALPSGPFEYITRQAQGDFVLMDQRNDNLWLDAGIVTEAFGWSLDFVLGMNWYDWHGPGGTRAKEQQVIDRSLRMTMAMTPERHLRRVNWLLQAKPRLDRSLEALLEWRDEDSALSLDNVEQDLFFRVELQQLYRMPRSHSVLFVLRHYFLSFADLARIPKWRVRLHRVLRDLDPASERFTSMPGKDLAIEWLSRFDDGSPTSPGRGPDLSRLEDA